MVVWLRQDLRSHDHPALDAGRQLAASSRRPLEIVYITDPATNPAQTQLIDNRLRWLNTHDRRLAGTIRVTAGDPGEVLAALRPVKVYVTADHSPAGLRRDRRVADRLGGSVLESADTRYAIPPGTLTTGAGTGYKVYTPFFNAWQGCGADPVHGELPRRGDDPVWDDWLEFIGHRLPGYRDSRDIPAVDGTSRMSAALAIGAIHPREMLATIGSGPAGADDCLAYTRELAFREFYADVLFRRPETEHSNVNPKFNAMALNTSGEELTAWAQGRTGFPIVDAGMRQLNATGWMHNRVRMLAASFLTKDLHLPWQDGADYFAATLIDFDPATNQHSWQWCAGTGTDASPYFRIFNPQTQGKKFDPQATYITRWVPELAGVAPADIHAQRNLPAAYPAPLVDHAAERAEALARWEAIK